MRKIRVYLSLVSLVVLYSVTAVAANSVSSVVVDAQRVVLTATEGVEKIRYFSLESPKRLVVDLYGVQPGEQQKSYQLSNGFNALRIGPYQDKTRFVLDVEGDEFPSFNVNTENSQVVVTWEPKESNPDRQVVDAATVGSSRVVDIQFSADKGVSSFFIAVDGSANASKITRDGNKVVFSLLNTTLPKQLRRPFDTLAFPSAVHSLTPYVYNAHGRPNVRFSVILKDDVPYELKKVTNGYALVVTDGAFADAAPAKDEIFPVAVMTDGGIGDAEAQSSSTTTVNVEERTQVIRQIETKEKVYTGDKTTLVFDNADIRDILRLIAEISNLNIITSEEVKGELTLRLIDVPWDQALDLVLDIAELEMLQEGNVVRIISKTKYRAMVESELRATKVQEDQTPTEIKVFTISYADLKNVIDPVQKALSARGKITPDERNKFLIVEDVPARLDKAEELINILDTPERQVLIEARIIEVNTNYSRDLGVNWGVDYDNPGDRLGSAGLGIGGEFLVSLPAGGGSAAIEPGLGAGLTFGRIGIDKTVLDLRISALESNGMAKVVSMPKVTTLNGEEAVISQGTSIPYQTSGADGPKTEFVNAELKLEVTPVINPDNSVILDILATNDSPSITAGASAPSIDTKKAETKVLVRDGETTVIGGIFVENVSDSESGTPWLKDLPWVGKLFKSNKKTNTKAELLVFITPRILTE